MLTNSERTKTVVFKMAAKQCAAFRIEFSGIPKKPSRADAMKFLVEVLKLEPSKLEMVQFMDSATAVIVELKTTSDARNFVEAHDCVHTITCDGVAYRIPIRTSEYLQQRA